MERLLDKKDVLDPSEECLADLVRASEPVAVGPARKQRVLNRVLLRQQTRWSATSRLLRPVFALGILSLAGATAAATIGRRAWIDRHAEPGARAMEPIAAAPPARRSRHSFAAAAADEAPPSPTAAPAPVVTARPRRLPKAVSHTRIASSEDPSRVVDAIQALRNDHDPVRAGRLLSEYLTRYPHGALAEEAVALSIEAAAARHSPNAAVFAERYLRQYPNGRFRRAAEQALDQRQN